jgi:hypothetical protein
MITKEGLLCLSKGMQLTRLPSAWLYKTDDILSTALTSWLVSSHAINLFLHLYPPAVNVSGTHCDLGR